MKSNLKLLINLFILIASIGCEERSNRSNIYIEKKVIVDSSNIEIKPDSGYVNRLVRIIESSDCYYGRGIGITGEPSNVYLAFENLKKVASDSMWINFSFSKSSIMKLYSYDALAHNTKYRVILRGRLMHDSTSICIRSNDITINCSLREYISLNK